MCSIVFLNLPCETSQPFRNVPCGIAANGKLDPGKDERLNEDSIGKLVIGLQSAAALKQDLRNDPNVVALDFLVVGQFHLHIPLKTSNFDRWRLFAGGSYLPTYRP
jgi:hypothetical protein